MIFKRKKIPGDIRMEWRIFLARQNPGKAVSVVILIFICAYLVQLGTEDLLLSLASFLVLFMAVSSYYVPVRYLFTDTHIYRLTIFSRQSRQWEAFHNYQSNGNYIRLTTMKKSSRLDNYRGMLLICPTRKKDEILAFVEAKIEKNSQDPKETSKNDLT